MYLTRDLQDLPPMHAEVEITLRGQIVGPFQLKELTADRRTVWVTVVKLKASERRGNLKVVAPPPPPTDEIDLNVPRNGRSGR